MTKQQYLALLAVAALAVFIGVGATLLITSGDDDTEVTSGTTSSSSSTSTTTPPTTVAPTTGPTTPVTPATPPPATTIVIPPSTTTTHAPATTRPPVTTRPSTTTTSTTEPPGRTDVGITATEIRLAVIADDDRVFQGMNIWKTVVNRRGGLAERKVRLDLLQTGGTPEGYANAVQSACTRDFAIVGSFSVFDAPTEALGCGAIPEVPVESIAAEHATAGNAYAAFPREPGTTAAGPYKYFKDNSIGCCTQYVLVPDVEPTRARTLAVIDAAAAIGFDTAGMPDVSESDPESRYDELVDEIEAAPATFAASGLGATSTIQLRQAAAGRAPDVAWFCDDACYDPSFLADGGDAVEDEYVAIETTPFSDRLDVPSLRAYLRATARAEEDHSYLGLRAYVAGLLFERAAESVIDGNGNDGLTRLRLLDALAGIHDFTAGGIVGATDIGARTPTGCYVLLKVQGGKFKRVNPAEKGELSCGADNLVSADG